MKYHFAPLLFTLSLFAAPSFAQKTTSNTQLNHVRQAIEATQKDLDEKQAAQKATEQHLEQTRLALEKIQRELEELNRQQRNAWEKLQELQTRLTQLQTETAGTKAQVSRLLIANYKNRRPNAVVLFLENADPNQKSRFLNYTRYINQSNERVLKLLTQQQNELSQQETAINTELERLRQLTVAQQKKMRELGQNRSKAQTVSRQLNADITRQKAHLDKLREDEQRLSNVIADISARRSAERQAQANAQTQAAQQRAQNASQQNTDNTSNQNDALTLSDSQTISENSGLSRKKGRLPLPTQGKISGRFGAERVSGGVWRGLFIETPVSAVNSIAAGKVSYAAPLTGYGNTIIIDHGEGYMSVYSGLSSIAISNGSHVKAGQTIGNSGKLPAGEEGLYFELRHRNQAMNPSGWVK
ncbi:MAG: peptidoglycan DD-metalloendopeptidase family protein [Alysiella sp.]|uniref:murein hydrolase activator EnvC family protein n=1 Tax=Alysiella sp. TaxID=1872483 RepID=UPI0026DCB56E|nr:peptidoglycan DD-metalloendopeptidase family protein [Alysiella sp.]MDO4433388.1 peptidoglycan DD-metalloendopeptidase family protein [Alysiella sp.]